MMNVQTNDAEQSPTATLVARKLTVKEDVVKFFSNLTTKWKNERFTFCEYRGDKYYLINNLDDLIDDVNNDWEVIEAIETNIKNFKDKSNEIESNISLWSDKFDDILEICEIIKEVQKNWKSLEHKFRVLTKGWIEQLGYIFEKYCAANDEFIQLINLTKQDSLINCWLLDGNENALFISLKSIQANFVQIGIAWEDFYEVIDDWEKERLLWIAHLKKQKISNNSKQSCCYFSKLPKDIIQHIASFIFLIRLQFDEFS